jgi:hypothetical protein
VQGMDVVDFAILENGDDETDVGSAVYVRTGDCFW